METQESNTPNKVREKRTTTSRTVSDETVKATDGMALRVGGSDEGGEGLMRPSSRVFAKGCSTSLCLSAEISWGGGRLSSSRGTTANPYLAMGQCLNPRIRAL
ncbi:hypothetical protein NQZ68_028220 [Dissostichus eleginoides]|nr:hypothetical protein NQZ68_028220 [Dissostichus eleginoides]